MVVYATKCSKKTPWFSFQQNTSEIFVVLVVVVVIVSPHRFFSIYCFWCNFSSFCELLPCLPSRNLSILYYHRVICKTFPPLFSLCFISFFHFVKFLSHKHDVLPQNTFYLMLRILAYMIPRALQPGSSSIFAFMEFFPSELHMHSNHWFFDYKYPYLPNVAVSFKAYSKNWSTEYILYELQSVKRHR